MSGSHGCRAAIAATLWLVLAPPAVASAQRGFGTSVLRSEVTLDARTVSVTFDPTLAADEAAHRRVLAASALHPGFRVRVAELESNAALSVGVLALGRVGSAPLRYDLWLANAADGWVLQLSASRTGAWPPGGPGQGPPIIAAVPLAHGPAPAQPTFTAGLVPVGPLAARLVLQWGAHRWTTRVEFAPGNPPRLAPSPGDDETVVKIIARAQTLSERNETALTLPSGRRISVLFWKGLDVDGRDFARIASARDGTVIQLTAGAVTRLKTDVPRSTRKPSR